MLLLILILLIIFWFLGYGPIEALNIPLLTIRGQVIDLWDLVIFGLIMWLLGLLPSPFRQIAAVALGLWVLTLFGFIAIGGLSSILIIAVILGLVFYLIGMK